MKPQARRPQLPRPARPAILEGVRPGRAAGRLPGAPPALRAAEHRRACQSCPRRDLYAPLRPHRVSTGPHGRLNDHRSLSRRTGWIEATSTRPFPRRAAKPDTLLAVAICPRSDKPACRTSAREHASQSGKWSCSSRSSRSSPAACRCPTDPSRWPVVGDHSATLSFPERTPPDGHPSKPCRTSPRSGQRSTR